MFRINKGHVLSENEQAKVTKYIEPDYALFHNHDFFEIEYVIEGEGRHLIENNEFDVSAGDVYFTNKATPHCFMSKGKENQILVFNCIFTTEYFKNIKIDFDNKSNISDETLVVRFFPLFMRETPFIKLRDTNGFLLEKLSEAHKTKESAQKLVFELVLYILENCEKKINIQRDKDMMLSALYIEENYKNQIKTEDVASLFYMSKEYFGKKFKNFFGEGIKEFCQRLIIDDVAKKIVEDDKSFEEISFESGYSNTAYLRRLFKRYKGVLPQEYKREYFAYKGEDNV